jgi:hypothetical protein
MFCLSEIESFFLSRDYILTFNVVDNHLQGKLQKIRNTPRYADDVGYPASGQTPTSKVLPAIVSRMVD